ncbi:MAG: hypothetical protein KF886_18085 [Candidatus Hydrogenedentes bacterium]|nr:hypothetical protein [Candidatus Hydrogenedentota bacterium]
MHTNASGAAAGGDKELCPRIALMTRIENDFGRWGVQAAACCFQGSLFGLFSIGIVAGLIGGRAASGRNQRNDHHEGHEDHEGKKLEKD